MNKVIRNRLSKKFQKYDIKEIESGASKKIIYKLSSVSKSYILIDFNLEVSEYKKYIYVYNILSACMCVYDFVHVSCWRNFLTELILLLIRII